LNFKTLVHRFLRLCLLCIVKKSRLDLNKTDGDTFWSLPLWRFQRWQWRTRKPPLEAHRPL